MKRFLVVDDSRVVRRVAREILSDAGFEVVEAADGAEALRSCTACLPDGILLDWNMPVMNGIDCLHQLREMHGAALPAVIFCTTETDVAQIEAALNAGAREYIMKPFDREILLDKVEQVGLS
jgi:two-component system, chemotaxis family, chemotaxis protein CheY